MFKTSVEREIGETEYCHLQRICRYRFKSCFFSLLDIRNPTLTISDFPTGLYSPVQGAYGNDKYDVDGLLVITNNKRSHKEQVCITHVAIACLKMDCEQLTKMNIGSFLRNKVCKALNGLKNLEKVTVLVYSPTVGDVDRVSIAVH